MITQAPILEQMFISPGVLSPSWVKFFTSLERSISNTEENVTVIEEIISEGSSDLSEELSALTSSVNNIKTSETSSTYISAAQESTSILTLYWMGV